MSNGTIDGVKAKYFSFKSLKSTRYCVCIRIFHILSKINIYRINRITIDLVVVGSENSQPMSFLQKQSRKSFSLTEYKQLLNRSREENDFK